MSQEGSIMLKEQFDNLRAGSVLVHNITNYVTVNDVANAILACGASPIMSDEPEDVEDIIDDFRQAFEKCGLAPKA